MLKDFIFMSGGDRSGYYSGGSVFLRVYFMNQSQKILRPVEAGDGGDMLFLRWFVFLFKL